MLRGCSNYSPSKDLLEELNMSEKRFHEIINNECQPGFEEAFRLARWLKVNIQICTVLSFPKIIKGTGLF